MKGKSLAVNLISVILAAIASYGTLVSVDVQAWLGIVSFTLTLVLSTFFASGTMPEGWTPMMWVTNIVGIVIQVLTLTADRALLDPATVNYIIIGINILMQTFIKNYPGQGGESVLGRN